MKIYLLLSCLLNLQMTFAQANNYCAALINLPKLSDGTRQVILVHHFSGEPIFVAKADLCERQKNGKWLAKNRLELKVIVGRNGIAPSGKKREGDNRTPSGLFLLGEAFGYGPVSTFFPHIKMDYRYIVDKKTANKNNSKSWDKFVDDISDNNYNRWVIGPTEAKSFEEMRRKDNKYKFGVVVNYNMNPVRAGYGSVILLHIWEEGNKYTSGCVAFKENQLRNIINWLDKAEQPAVYIREK